VTEGDQDLGRRVQDQTVEIVRNFVGALVKLRLGPDRSVLDLEIPQDTE
jgi:hypothetical protein